MENQSINILNYVHENAEMGVQSITKILECVDDCSLDAVLARQLEKYRLFLAEAQDKLVQHNATIKHVPKMTALMRDMSINIKTMHNCSCSKIAEMMLQGTTMGIINATKTIKLNKNADTETIDLATRLLEFEEKQFDNIKELL